MVTDLHLKLLAASRPIEGKKGGSWGAGVLGEACSWEGREVQGSLEPGGEGDEV